MFFPVPLSVPAGFPEDHFVFSGPHFVAVNNKNEIVVTDFHNHSVKVSVLPHLFLSPLRSFSGTVNIYGMAALTQALC